ncbi:hypothetical protein VCHA53O466_50059 [Vibrio chagasii]|nr:hypothetical protein VCHA53O466_50059 [Vibrio chagasii]
MSKHSLLSILSDNPLSLKSMLEKETVYSAFALELVESNHNGCANDVDSINLRVAFRALKNNSHINHQLSPSSIEQFISLVIESDSLDCIHDAIDDLVSKFTSAFFAHKLIESHSPQGWASPCFILTDKGKCGFPLTYDKAAHLLI